MMNEDEMIKNLLNDKLIQNWEQRDLWGEKAFDLFFRIIDKIFGVYV